jgi:hypothetical protein
MGCERCNNILPYDLRKAEDVRIHLFKISELVWADLCTKCINNWIDTFKHHDLYKKEELNVTEMYGLELMSHNVTIPFERCQEAKQSQLDLAWEIRPVFLKWLRTKKEPKTYSFTG